MDEAMVKYKGHTSLKQYMPMKPIKRGIKMWCSADSHSGYVTLTFTLDIIVTVWRSVDYSVVTRLCKEIKGKWYEFYFDNCFHFTSTARVSLL